MRKIGLSEYEARIYGILLVDSPASASFIAKKAALSRSSVYTTIAALVSKGLVGTTYKNEIKQFVAEGYEALEDLLKKEKNQLDEKYSTLSKLKESLKENPSSLSGIPRIIFFEGKEGLQKIYRSMLWNAQQNSVMYIIRDEFVWNKDWDFIFGKEWHEFVKQTKIKKNITTKLLVNSSALEKKKQTFYKSKKGLEVAYLPAQNTLSQFALYILADEVSILSFENNNLVGIRITNKNIAQNFIALFKQSWAKSKK